MIDSFADVVLGQDRSLENCPAGIDAGYNRLNTDIGDHLVRVRAAVAIVAIAAGFIATLMTIKFTKLSPDRSGKQKHESKTYQ